MALVTVIGRGHSGTRAISHTLYASGVYMGACLNPSGDLIPPESMYDACKIIAQHVGWHGGLEWDFSPLHTMEIPQAFTLLIEEYLAGVLQEHARNPQRLCGWKIPETTLVFPWLRRLMPDMKYIFWVRDPRDSILGAHITDDLDRFGIPYSVEQASAAVNGNAERGRLYPRAVSWKYQYDLVQSTPKPEQWLQVRFEDFVLEQEATLQRLEEFLEIPLARIVVRPDSVGRWRAHESLTAFDFIRPALAENNYLA